jgi:ABC-type lipoprotein export system ATPase subunit
VVEGDRLESGYPGKLGSWVRIPLSPPFFSTWRKMPFVALCEVGQEHPVTPLVFAFSKKPFLHSNQKICVTMQKISKISIFPGFDKSGNPESFDSIDILKGETIAIVGATGSGKSQLLYDIEKIANGDTKSQRNVLINDKVANRKRRFDPKEKLIASLSQSMHFLTDLPVEEFLSLHLQARGKEPSKELISEVITEANEITGEAITHQMNLLSLSGGQSRALMIADVAHISTSPIILIDEIENAGIRKEKAIEVLIKEGKIVLIVTHDPALALKADKRIIIKNGGIASIITTSENERKIARHLNKLEEASLRLREKIRNGEAIEKL